METNNHSHPAQRQGAREEVSENIREGAESLVGDITQQPREFSFQCPYNDCEYTTVTLYDPKQIGYLVKLLSMHTQGAHGQNMDDGLDNSNSVSNKSDKEGKELKAALSKRNVQKVLDDANTNLCEARFFAFPLNKKALGQNVPIAITAVNTVVDLTSTGVNVTNRELLRKLHNRGTTKCRLSDFSLSPT